MPVLSIHIVFALPAEHVALLSLGWELDVAVFPLCSAPHSLVQLPVLVLVGLFSRGLPHITLVLRQSPGGCETRPFDDLFPAVSQAGVELPLVDGAEQVSGTVRGAFAQVGEREPNSLDWLDQLVIERARNKSFLLLHGQIPEFVSLHLFFVCLAEQG